MSLSTVCQPYGGLHGPLVDKVLGPNAYDVVRYVALNMEHINRASTLAGNMRHYSSKIVQGRTVIPLVPGVTLDRILDYKVTVRTLDGRLINEAAGKFTCVVSAAGLLLTTTDTTLENADVRFSVSYLGVTPYA